MADKRLRLIVEAVTSQAQQKLRSFANSIKQFGDQASRSMDKPARATQDLSQGMGLLAKAGTFFLADLGLRYGRMAAEALMAAEQMAASNLAIADSYEAVAAKYSLGSNEILEAIDKASKGTIDKFSAMATASKAMRMGVATDVGEFENLMKIAYMRGRETGEGTAKAWARMAEGIGGASPWMLRGLNILMDTNDVLERHARLLGIDADELSKTQEQEAIRNEVLRQGADDLERWAETGGDARDVFEQWNAVNVELRQEMGERLLPTVIKLTQALIDLQTASKGYHQDARDVVNAVLDEGGTIDDAVQKLEEYNRAHLRGREGLVSLGDVLDKVTIQEKNLAIVQDAVAERWGRMHQESAAARTAIQDVGDATDDTTKDLEEQQEALEKGAKIWGDYLRSVAEENWRSARRVEDAQFSMMQAAERAMFDMMKIERDAGDRRGDILESADIRAEARTAQHYNRLRYMKQDLTDDLADMEYVYQQEKKELLDEAPWWVRNALGKEFKERERIARTGDKKALAEYDKALLAKVKAADPAYAKLLQKLQERYDHEEQIEKRETGQSLAREKDSWQISSREQERGLDQQLRELERNLGYRRDEWNFHQGQREDSERWSMDRLITDQEHSLVRMYETIQRKLSEITPLFAFMGEQWATSLIESYQAGLNYWPAPPGEPDWTNPFGPGGTYGAAAPVAAAGAGTTVNIDVNVGGGWTPYQAQEVAEVLGQKIRQQLR